MKRYISFFLITLLAVIPLLAESTWEGITAVSRYGEFPESGNYGASNSFSINTAIKVKNIETGKESTVIITDRLEDPGLFLLVSKDVGKELGISQGEIARVRASIAQPEGAITAFPDDLPYNPDPDVNPAASVGPVPERLEPVPTEEKGEEVVEADETEPEETEEVAEIAEPEVEETGEAVAPEETETEIAETTPRINGVDAAEQPAEEAPPSEPTDQPSPPVEEPETAEASTLESADESVAEEPRLVVETPLEPAAEEAETPSVLGLYPAPEIDQTESFVLLAEPDVPDTSELAGEPEADMRISSLDQPEIAEEEEELGVIVPPEPAFAEKPAEIVEPVAEDLLIVSNLDEPDAVAIASFEVPEVEDEPEIPDVSGEAPTVLALDPADVEEETAAPEIADVPEITEEEEAEVPELRYSLLDVPEEPEAEAVAEGEREKPRVVDVVPDEDAPVVVNGFAPEVPEEVEIVLEPAEPKPPEPRIAESDLLEEAEGEEPKEDVEVAAVTEPEVIEAAEPEEPEAAEEPPVTKPTEVREPPVELAYTTKLDEDDYYLQLAAFTEARPAARLKADLADVYPVTVYLTETTDRRVYKVLVGPLNQDESGALLYQFRVRGFPDAFVRVGALN